MLDAALIAAAQAVEHYEMTRYGTLISWAKELGRNDCVALLQQTLDEEKATDKKLTAMAEGQVNRKAAVDALNPKVAGTSSSACPEVLKKVDCLSVWLFQAPQVDTAVRLCSGHD